MNRTAGRFLAAGCVAVAAVAFPTGAAWAGPASQASPVQKAVPAPGALAPTTATPAVAPATGETIHMTIAGISGDGPGGKIVCHSFRRGQAATIGSATGGAGAGKIKFNEFTIKKTTDKASPAFFRAAATGRHFDSVLFEFYRGQPDVKAAGKASKTKEVKYLVIKLTDVLVTSVRETGGGDRPMEEITFAAAKVETQ